MEIAWATALTNTSFPSLDNNFSFYPFNFFHFLSFKQAKIAFLDLPIIVGNPTYFSCFSTSHTPRVSIISFLVTTDTFLLKSTFVFLRFTFWPEDLSYLLIISATIVHSWKFSLANKILSSAKKRCKVLGAPLQICTPCISLAAFVINVDKASTYNKISREKLDHLA